MSAWATRSRWRHDLGVYLWLDDQSHDDLVAVLERRIRERGHIAITVLA